ncbi:copper amine oxidase N-terminal domain-containing protein [Paenibacillus sp. GCM10012307]|uniref:Copper amine oxidase N-terminal domain-containing protein n=1 Tax=Paenibacillus roseus TaxID=2798579 RepID=A0A934J1M4_9BACL|nr:copper amine oxidase N-terminal domain-containing protein [Paenibacillus roseus]MBJ6361634.1 copper amine oxidase N-terminal domain-containing protein [Paenibacillus roseus]
MKKAWILSILCVVLFSVGVIPASAASNRAHIFVDGVPLQSKSMSKNNVSFVPFRELFEKLDMDIKFDAKLKQVTGTNSKLKITFTVGSKVAYVNGQKKTLQAAPFTENGTTYIPIRIVGEATGNAVYWSSKANVIQINSPSFKGASYTVDSIPVYFSANGAVLFGSEALKEQKILYKLAEEDAIKNVIANFPKVRIVGEPPTAEESKDPGYKGYPDYFDVNYVTAVEKKEKLPPLLSQGWISLALLSEIEKINNLGSREPNTIVIGKYIGGDIVRKSIVLTDAYKKAKDGDFVLSDIRVKKYKGSMYLNIEDLQTAGLIKN